MQQVRQHGSFYFSSETICEIIMDLNLKEKAQQDEILPTQTFYVLPFIQRRTSKNVLLVLHLQLFFFLFSDVEISFEYSLGAEEGWTKITQAETTLPSVNTMCT